MEEMMVGDKKVGKDQILRTPWVMFWHHLRNIGKLSMFFKQGILLISLVS